MKLIKIQPDKVQIKSNDKEFRDIHINDLINISDGITTLITMVSSLTDNEIEMPLEEDDFLDSYQVPSVKNIECSIMGSLVDGKFTNSVDKFPTTDVKAEIITNKQFGKMINSNVDGFSIGNYANYNCLAAIDGNKFFQRHSCIVGNTGSGKSETVTKIIEETHKNTSPNMIIFDIHGEYKSLSYVDNITIGNGFPFPIWLFGFLDMALNILKVKEESATVVMSALRKAYKEVCDNTNEGKPVYFSFSELVKALEGMDNEQVGTGEYYKSGAKAGQEKTVKGDYNGKLSGIVNIMKTIYNNKRYSFLFDEKPQSYLNEVVGRIMKRGITNIDLSEIPHDVALMIIGAITKIVYEVQVLQKGNIKPITLVCDEAHVYIPVDFNLSASQRRMVDIFENIAKEGRKFGVTLFVASQRPSELNKTIMAQCANYIVMKLNNETDKTMMKGIMADGSSGVIEATTTFFPGDALVIGDALPIPLKIHVDLAEERPQAKTIQYWEEWAREEQETVIDGYLEEYLRN
jgi:hypothetical protein